MTVESTQTTGSRQVALSFGVGLLVLARGLILLPILTKNIALPSYGVWAQITAALGLVLPLASLGLDNAVMRMWPSRRDRREAATAVFTILATVAISSGVLALVGFALARPLGELTGEREGETLIRLASLSIVVASIERFVGLYFRAYRKVGVYSIVQLADAYLSVAATAFLVLAGLGLLGAIAGPLIVQAAIALIGISFIAATLGIARPDPAQLRSYLSFALPLLPTGVFLWVLNAADRFILGAIDGASAVAVYSVGYQWSTYTTLFFNPIFLVLIPRVAELWDARRTDEALSAIERATRVGLLLTLPTIVGASLLGPALLRLITTPDYVPGAVVIPLVGLGYLLFMLSGMNETVLNLQLRNRPLVVVYLAAALFNLVTTYVLVLAAGFVGAALATLLTFAVLATMTTALAQRGRTFRVDLVALLRQAVAAVVMAVVVTWFAPSDVVSLILAIPLGATTYFATLFLLRGIDPADVRLVREAIFRS